MLMKMVNYTDIWVPWHYVTDKLPPNPKESEDGKSILPLNYICAYDCGDGDYECDEFM